MGLSREEMIALGLSLPTDALTEWSGAMHSAASRQISRLGKRGITAAFLAEIARCTSAVPKLETDQAREKKDLPPVVDEIEKVRDDAFDWWREARESAKVEFGTDPDALVEFRPGIHVGGSTARLVQEIRCLVPILRGRMPQLGWLGIGDDFLRRGETLANRLDEMNRSVASACQGLPPKTAEFFLTKAQLYDLTRKLVRIARIEFRKEPEMAETFGYDIVRREIQATNANRPRVAASSAKR